MSSQRFPPLSKSFLSDFDHTGFMNKHAKRNSKTKNSKNNCESFKDTDYKQLFKVNPKKNYFLEQKHTEIERQNRLLFEKISKQARGKRVNTSFSQNHIGILDTLSRRQQMDDISKENMRLLAKIVRQKASVSFVQIEKDHGKSRSTPKKKSNSLKNKKMVLNF